MTPNVKKHAARLEHEPADFDEGSRPRQPHIEISQPVGSHVSLGDRRHGHKVELGGYLAALIGGAFAPILLKFVEGLEGAILGGRSRLVMQEHLCVGEWLALRSDAAVVATVDHVGADSRCGDLDDYEAVGVGWGFSEFVAVNLDGRVRDRAGDLFDAVSEALERLWVERCHGIVGVAVRFVGYADDQDASVEG